MVSQHHLTRATGILVVVHTLCVLLDVQGVADWPTREHPSLFALLADNRAWPLIHLAAATALLLALAAGRARSYVAGVSGVLLILWGAALAGWGAQLQDPPVSLLGPALAVAFGVMAVILAHAWADLEV